MMLRQTARMDQMDLLELQHRKAIVLSLGRQEQLGSGRQSELSHFKLARYFPRTYRAEKDLVPAVGDGLTSRIRETVVVIDEPQESTSVEKKVQRVLTVREDRLLIEFVEFLVRHRGKGIVGIRDLSPCRTGNSRLRRDGIRNGAKFRHRLIMAQDHDLIALLHQRQVSGELGFYFMNCCLHSFIIVPN